MITTYIYIVSPISIANRFWILKVTGADCSIWCIFDPSVVFSTLTSFSCFRIHMAFNHAGYQFNGWILRMGFFENVIRQKIACSLFSCHCLRQWLLFLYTPQSSVSLHDITSWHHFVTISNLLFKQAKYLLSNLSKHFYSSATSSQ